MALIETDTQETAVTSADPTAAISERFAEPAWLAKNRRRAWESYSSASLPDRIGHLWRYTDPKHFELTTDQVLPQLSEMKLDESRQLWESEQLSGVALWQGGQIVHLELDSTLKAKGVLLVDLHTAARDYSRLVEAHLGRTENGSLGKFESLNAALWQAGLFLHVPRHVVIEKPIHLIIAGDEGTPFLAPRLLIALEEGAQATVVDEFTSPRDARFDANTSVEACVGANSNLRLVTIQRWGEHVTSYFNQRTVLSRDANLLAVWAGLGAGMSKAELRTRLDGRGANVKLLGMSFGQRGQHFDQHTVHDHRAGNSTSDLDFKVVLKDKARSAYTGLIRIEQNAPNCEAYQENRNLLLTEGTRADTIPELEILTDEVRCTHGATIGPLDEEELFYLTARGIPRDEAVRMVVSGFVEPTLNEVPEDLRDRLRSYVIERVREI
jgi:Fe-S cluster assembly protein SufD